MSRTPKTCPECGKTLEEFFRNNKTYLGCSNFPNCRYTLDLSNFEPQKDGLGRTTYPAKCPQCNNKLAIYISKDWQFFGCNGYPGCRFSINFNTLENALCPMCGKPMIEQTGKYGLFLGCTGYPDCNFTYDIHIFTAPKYIGRVLPF